MEEMDYQKFKSLTPDEQNYHIVSSLNDIKNLVTTDSQATSSRMKIIEDNVEKNYVTRTEFWPVKTIVYSGAGIVLTGVLGGLLTLIIK